MAEQQIKSRQRVAERGEVFTAEREVNAMLDLVKQETERIDSRFLEPACGTGNFLVEILRRKLEVIKRQYQKQMGELELQTTIALSSIYGIDIMKDNVEECCQRLLDIVCSWYSEVHPQQKVPSQKLSTVWSYLLHRNILWGDALTLREPVSEKATAIEKQNAIIKALKEETDADKDRIEYLIGINQLLQQSIIELQNELKQYQSR